MTVDNHSPHCVPAQISRAVGINCLCMFTTLLSLFTAHSKSHYKSNVLLFPRPYILCRACRIIRITLRIQPITRLVQQTRLRSHRDAEGPPGFAQPSYGYLPLVHHAIDLCHPVRSHQHRPRSPRASPKRRLTRHAPESGRTVSATCTGNGAGDHTALWVVSRGTNGRVPDCDVIGSRDEM